MRGALASLLAVIVTVCEGKACSEGVAGVAAVAAVAVAVGTAGGGMASLTGGTLALRSGAETAGAAA
ncbi:hypothetical protein BA896_017525 [Janthinobacterium lividum]|uniref:Uncharacterized protein n=1 Tax=Janthinobacterium lividum TaxID=29581 RepID=A0A1E8PKU3_9BURK|nr:hypothetical protein BA896_017525 [Janthinobacterium lividum]